MQGYARRHGCDKAIVMKACEGRLAFAVQDGKIDRDIADALSTCPQPREKILTSI